MSVYLVVYRDYDITNIYAAFTTREGAEGYKANYVYNPGATKFFINAQGPGDLYIEEVDLDPEPMVESLMFKDEKCLVCGHLEGDHEGPYDGQWFCDDDGCEDNLDECRPVLIKD